jgi:subfamily B ATP-binding cassette protein MsbA
MNSTPLKVLISVGERSADEYGAELLMQLKELHPGLIARGMGGQNLARAGMEIVVDSEAAAGVMGFQEVARKVGSIFGAFKKLVALANEWRPDIIILIDFPDFNLRLAKKLAHLESRVVYFIPPKVWAWRAHRVRYLRRYVDHVFAIFPFEVDFLKARGFESVSFFGHPLTDSLQVDRANPTYQTRRAQFLQHLHFVPHKPVVAVLPGSRRHELERHLPVMCAALCELRIRHPDLQCIIGLPAGGNEARYEKIFRKLSQLNANGHPWFQITEGAALSAMEFADIGIIKSGTSNLQAMLCDLPFVMCYQASRMSEFVLKPFLKITQYSLVNILRPNTVTELVQADFNAKRIVAEAEKLLDDATRTATRASLTEARAHLQGDVKTRTESVIARIARETLRVERTRKTRAELYRRVLGYLHGYKKEFFLALLCMILFGASDGAIPFIIKKLLDDVFGTHNATLLYILPVFLIGYALFRAVVDFGQQYLAAKVGHSVVKDIRNEVNDHLLGMSAGFFWDNSSGALVSRVTNDVLLIRSLMTDVLAALLRDSVRVIALVGAALYLDPVLALIALIGFPLGFYPVYRFSRKLRRLSRAGQEILGRLSELLQESVLGQRVVKSFNREAYEQERFQSRNQELTGTLLRSEKIRALSGPINEVLAMLAIAAVIVYGGFSVMQGTRTEGDFIAFLVAVFLMYDPYKKLSRMNSALQQGLAGAERIFEVLDMQSPVREVENPRSLTSANTITFDAISFRYRPGLRYVLEDINLTVPEGKTVALVGLSGAGKSTLVDLVPRFIDPTEGAVRIGGVDIREVGLRELRSRIGLVSQHTFLFNDTVLNNIVYGKDGATRAEIEAAAEAAHALHFIRELRNGFDTIIGEGGYTLSGGQRQRIAIARAILKDAPILLLDEATAALDNRSEAEVQAALKRLQEGRTVLVVAHRLSTIVNADLIVVMQAGKIIEQGTHTELLARRGAYAHLHGSAFQETGALDTTTA